MKSQHTVLHPQYIYSENPQTKLPFSAILAIRIVSVSFMAPSSQIKSEEIQHIIKPKDLRIVWGEDKKYWRLPRADQEDLPAELLEVYWLEVTGSVDIDPLKSHQVGFQLSLTSDAFGWDGTTIYIMAKKGEKGQYVWRKVNLTGHKANEEFIIPDNFVLDEDPSAFDRKLFFGLYEIWNGNKKGGLRVHQAIVKELNSITPRPDSITPTHEPDNITPSPGPDSITPSPRPYTGGITLITLRPRDFIIADSSDKNIWRMPPPGQEDQSALLVGETNLDITGNVEIDPLKLYQIGFKISFQNSSVPESWKSLYQFSVKRGNATVHEELFDFVGYAFVSPYIFPKNFVLNNYPHSSETKLSFSLKYTEGVKLKGGFELHQAFVKELDSDFPVNSSLEDIGGTLQLVKASDLKIIGSDDEYVWDLPRSGQRNGPAKAIGVRRLEVTTSRVVGAGRKRIQVGFQVSLASNAFGWEGNLVHVSCQNGTGKPTFSMGSSLLGRKANERFLLPENFVLEIPPLGTPSDGKISIRMYDSFPERRKGGLVIHNAFLVQLDD